MAAELKKATMENYLLCPKCSELEGEEVYYHKRGLKKHKPLFGAETRVCPEGHELPEGAA